MRSSPEGPRPGHHVNDLIDRALRQPTDAHFRAVARLPAIAPQDLAERVRRRATLLARRDRRNRAPILQARDRLMLALYANATPAGWHTAWCDGSLAAARTATGIGGLVVDASGRIVAEFARRVPDQPPFEAEIAAVVATLEAAHAHGARRLRVYSDCGAAVRLWHQRRDDARLAALAALAGEFRRLQICVLPRLHNQPAHRLAQAGAGPSGA